MSAMDGAVWNVLSYPSNAVIHTAPTYEAASHWRIENDDLSYICPTWPDEDAAWDDFNARLEADVQRIQSRPWWKKLLGIGIVP